MRLYGQICDPKIEKRVYGVKTHSKIYYIYFKNSLYSMFKNYLDENTIIDLEVVEPKIRGKHYIYQVYYVRKIKSILLDKVYFSEENNNLALKNIFKDINNTLILDLEMLMPPYNYKGYFNSEIVEIGYILYDNKDNSRLKYKEYIKVSQNINNRTSNFLHLKLRDYYRYSISFYKAYNDLKKILKVYKPTIIVYGRNDIIALKKAFQTYKLPNILNYVRIINLSSLIENYYHHKNEYGLFNLYNKFYNNNLSQEHDALLDAKITHELYKAFRKDLLEDKKSI